MKYINLTEKYTKYSIYHIAISENEEILNIEWLATSRDLVRDGLAKVFADYPNIVELRLTSSKLYDLSQFKPLQNLKKLKISAEVGGYGDWSVGSSVGDVSSLNSLPMLECLDISFGGENLDSFSKLTQIRSLRLSVDAVNPDLGPIGKLVQLNKLKLRVSGRWHWSPPRIDSIAQLEGLINLKSLDISHIGIKSLAPVKEMLSLEYLDCSNNFIRSIKSLEKLSKLRELNISGNKSLRDVSTLSKLKTLEKVDFNEIGADSSVAEPSDFF